MRRENRESEMFEEVLVVVKPALKQGDKKWDENTNYQQTHSALLLEVLSRGSKKTTTIEQGEREGGGDGRREGKGKGSKKNT